ncbi:MAG TPA: hypothetical protein VJZ31_02580, partial [Bacilli bacterium]|nr:hypothetical protein [Bacilli bacterium]
SETPPSSQIPSDTTSETPPSSQIPSDTTSEAPNSQPTGKAEINGTALNAFFGKDVYSKLPKIYSDDYEFYDDSSVDYPVDIYVDLYDWTEAEGYAYDDALFELLDLDEENGYILEENLFVIVTEDLESFDTALYSVNIYSLGTSEPGEPTDKDEIDGAGLNAFFGFDIYGTLPKIYSNDYDFYDNSSDEYPVDIYVDLFDWEDADAIAYDTELALAFEEDAELGYIIGENIFGFVFLDEEAYDIPVYSFNIFTVGDTTPVDPTDPVDPVDPGTVVTSTITSKAANTASIANGNVKEHLVVTNDAGLTFTYAANASTVTSIFNNSANEIRLYPGAGNGGSLTISSSNGSVFTSITIATTQNAGYQINGGSTITTSGITTTLAANTTSVKIQNTAMATSGSANQLRMTLITVEYTSGETVPTEPEEELSVGTTTVLTGMKTINEYQKQGYSISGIPSTGNVNVLLIPVEIKGYPFPSDYKANLELVFNGTSAATGWESVASYYTASSYGSLNLSFDITDKYTTTNTKAFYESKGDYGDEFAIVETLSAAGSVDFSQYDFNDDGLIDSVIFIYSTAYDYDVDPWWAWCYSGQYFEDHATPVKDGKEFGYYMWASYEFMFDETLGVNANVDAETYIHEFGHLLGLPDYYSQSHAAGPLGGWDMMDWNAGDHGPLNKLMLGWIDPLVATAGFQYDVTLDSYSLDTDGEDVALLIPRSNANFNDGDAFDEYLLIIYYTPNGLYSGHMGTDASISEAGIAIYHVDARLANDANEWEFFLNDNEGTATFLVSLLEADKNNSIPSNTSAVSNSDILRSGAIDLSTYSWNQGGSINVKIAIETMLPGSATLNVEVR